MLIELIIMAEKQAVPNVKKNEKLLEAIAEDSTEFGSEADMLAYLRSSMAAGADSVTVTLLTGGESRQLSFVRYRNPDGSVGGLIDQNLSAKSIYGSDMQPEDTFIDSTAVVYGNVKIVNSKIGPNSSVLALGQAQSYIEDTAIGSRVNIRSGGVLGPIVLDMTNIEDDVSLNIGKGILYIVRSTVHSGVVLESYADLPENPPNFKALRDFMSPYASSKDLKGASPSISIKVLDIDDSEIGSNSRIKLEAGSPRLRILSANVPANSKVTVDPRNYFIPVTLDGTQSNIFYKVRIPLLNDPVFSKFAKDAEDYANTHKLPKTVDQSLLGKLDADSAKQLQHTILIAKYVYDNIKYGDITDKYTKDVLDIPLDYFIDKGKGICFEHALLLYTILEKELAMQGGKVTPHFVTGLAKSDDVASWHAWVEVEINGKVFVIDATSPFMFAGKRTKSGSFVSSGPLIDWDYRPDGAPLVTPIPAAPTGINKRG